MIATPSAVERSWKNSSSSLPGIGIDGGASRAPGEKGTGGGGGDGSGESGDGGGGGEGSMGGASE